MAFKLKQNVVIIVILSVWSCSSSCPTSQSSEIEREDRKLPTALSATAGCIVTARERSHSLRRKTTPSYSKVRLGE